MPYSQAGHWLKVNEAITRLGKLIERPERFGMEEKDVDLAREILKKFVDARDRVMP